MQLQLTITTRPVITHSKLKSLWRSFLCLLVITPISEISFATTTNTQMTGTTLTPPTDAWKKYIVKQGDNLTTIFKHIGLSDKDVMNISESPATQNVFNRLMPKEQLLLLIQDNKLSKIRYYKKANNLLVISREQNTTNYLIDTIKPKADVKVAEPQKQTVTTGENSELTKTNSVIEDQPVKLAAKTPTSLMDTLNSAKSTSIQNRADNWIYYTVAPNDNLSSIFIRAGLSHSDVYYIGNASNNEQSFKNLQIGERIAFLIRNGHLIKVNYIINKMKNILYTRLDKTNY
ncbi:MAG: cell envelope opacity-associated protein A, partial [Oceanospirillaceae bacterium]